MSKSQDLKYIALAKDRFAASVKNEIPHAADMTPHHIVETYGQQWQEMWCNLLADCRTELSTDMSVWVDKRGLAREVTRAAVEALIAGEWLTMKQIAEGSPPITSGSRNIGGTRTVLTVTAPVKWLVDGGHAERGRMIINERSVPVYRLTDPQRTLAQVNSDYDRINALSNKQEISSDNVLDSVCMMQEDV